MARELNFDPDEQCTEATIQAEFYHHCRLKGIQCALEYSAVLHSVDGTISPRSRFDIVILNRDKTKVWAIIEVKKEENHSHEYTWYKTEQGEKYKQYGLPIYLVVTMQDIKTIINVIIRDLYIPSGYYKPNPPKAKKESQPNNRPNGRVITYKKINLL